MERADFLNLPPRAGKPRDSGITHVIDSGLAVSEVAAALRSGAEFVDVWKLGWGIAYLDPGLEEKLALLTRHGVLACPGGTLLEIAWIQHRVREFLDWAAEAGFPCVEVSSGVAPMTRQDKDKLIAEAAERFIVLAEVGTKDSATREAPQQWEQAVTADLKAGATWVLTEGRASGDVGVYTASGAVRTEVVEAVLAAAGSDSVVFEAPRKEQQAWFIQRLGADVNLANIRPDEVLGLETLRRGLRADTMEVDPAAWPQPAGRIRNER